MEDFEKNEILEKIENEVYKCPGCGANLKFDPKTSSMICEYCEYKLHIEGEDSTKEFNLDFDSAPMWDNESKTIHCQNCGSNNIVDANTFTYICPFCGSPSAIVTEEIKGMKPNRVIPFKVSSNDAVENYRMWLKKKFLAPNKVKKNIPNPNINGVYIPSWTYDADTFTKYNGKIGKYYTVTVGSGKNRRTVTKIRWYTIRGVHQSHFDDILVCASNKLEQDNLEKLSPYQTNQSFEYDNRFLIGFSSEHYALDVNDGFKKAIIIADKRIEGEILSKYVYDVVGNLNIKTTHDKVTYKYVLLPLWICFFKFSNKQYNFKVNGENGKIVGKYPISPIKVTILVVLGLILVLAIIILIAILYGG